MSKEIVFKTYQKSDFLSIQGDIENIIEIAKEAINTYYKVRLIMKL